MAWVATDFIAPTGLIHQYWFPGETLTNGTDGLVDTWLAQAVTANPDNLEAQRLNVYCLATRYRAGLLGDPANTSQKDVDSIRHAAVTLSFSQNSSTTLADIQSLADDFCNDYAILTGGGIGGAVITEIVIKDT